MSTAKSYISIYNRGGQGMVELDLPCNRSWLQNQFGTAEFVIPSNHEGYTPQTMAFRNPVVIRTPGLPLWGGFIWTPRKHYTDNSVVITAYGAELMLSLRYSPGFTGGAGDIFRQILNWANFSENTLITVGEVYESIQTFTDVGRPPDTLFDVLQTLIADTGLEYEIVPDTATGQLRFSANLKDRISRTITGFALQEGHNVEAPSGMAMIEQGQIANEITVYRDDGSGNYVATYFVSDTDSIAKYGLAQGSLTVEAGSQISDSALASAALANRKEPIRTFVLNAFNRAENNGTHTFDYLRLGNELTIKTTRIGLSDIGRGLTTTARVTGMSYDSGQNTMLLTMEEIRV